MTLHTNMLTANPRQLEYLNFLQESVRIRKPRRNGPLPLSAVLLENPVQRRGRNAEKQQDSGQAPFQFIQFSINLLFHVLHPFQ